MKKLVLAFICLILAVPSQAEIIIVDDDWPYDFNNIQAAIDYSSDGDFIYVLPGTYTGNGNRDIDFLGKAITVRGATGDPNDCIIDCQGTETNPHRGFKFISGEDANSVLEGLTITHGYSSSGGGINCQHSGPTINNCIINNNSTYSYYGHGGGIYNYDSSPNINNCTISGNSATYYQSSGGGIYNYHYSNPTISNCTISNNSATYHGGGIYNNDSSPIIDNCIVVENSAYRGGGIYNYFGNPTISHCAVKDNSAAFRGGGFYNHVSNAIIYNCTISYNSAGSGGGFYNYEGDLIISNCIISYNLADYGSGFYHSYCDPIIKGCVISNNSANFYGGGFLNYSSSPGINNCTISNNSTTSYGGGVHSSANSNPTISSCIIWGNNPPQINGTPVVTYSDIQGGFSGVGNIDADPCFVDDYHLSAYSPCIDAGDPNYVAEPNETDIDGDPRVVGRLDMGADEVYSSTSALIVIIPGILNFEAEGLSSNSQSQDISIKNYGIGILNWELSEPNECDWLGEFPTTGQVNLGESNDVEITVNPNIAGYGIHSCQLQVTSPEAENSPQAVTVNLEVLRSELSISDSVFDFIAAGIDSNTASQVLTIQNAGFDSLNWHIEMPNDCDWLKASPLAGQASHMETDEVILSIDHNNIDYGTYSCQLTVIAEDANNSPQVVTVNLEVLRPEIGVNNTNFYFTAYGKSDTSVAGQELVITNTGFDTLNWHIEISDCNWLNVFPTSGQVNTGESNDVEITVNPNIAGYGIHSCQLQVTAPDAENSPQTVTVNLEVLGPEIGLSQTNYFFTTYQSSDGEVDSQELMITNTGYDTINWQIEVPNDCNWLDVEPLQGQCTSETDVAVLTVDPEGLAKGLYTCEVLVSDVNANNSPVSIVVTLYIPRYLYVPTDYTTIQAAINDSNDGDIIVVQPGTYTGQGNYDIDFNGKAITVQSVDPEDPYIVAATVIDCNGLGRGFYFQSGEDTSSVLAGLTITKSWGGISCEYYSSPTITHCTITNSGATYGGGIYCEDHSSPTITNCNIGSNTAQYEGGGIYCEGYSGPKITNCTISANTAEFGGGIYCQDSTLTITGSTISGNSAADFGGGIYFQYGNLLKLTNCTFSGNSAEDLGGGIFCDNIERIFVTNSIFWANTDNGGVVSAAQINCMEFVEMPAIVYSCIQDANANDANIPFGAEANFNIDDDPCFVLLGYWGHANDTNIPVEPMDPNAIWVEGDYHLLRSSPCIEAGLPNFIVGPNVVDMDGQPRIIGLCVDMGADEFAPIIVVTRPQGGEVWANGSTHEINWDSFGITGTVDIYYSSNDGADWLMIDNTTDSGSYMWQLPGAVDSNQCLVAVEPNTPVPDILCIESGLFTIHPDSPGPAVVSKWKSLGGDFDRAGLSENYGPELGCVKWQFQTDAPVSASATIGASGRIHLSCEDGKVYALDANGVHLWSYDTNSPLLSSPTIGPDGTVYVGGQDGKLYAISIAGRLRWTHDTEGFIYSSPAVSPDGNVYACSQDGTLYALGQDGSELWTFETAGPGVASGAIFASPAIAPNGTVYIAGVYDPNLYALDSNDGSVKWDCAFLDPCDPNSPKPWPFASPVIAADGTIYMSLLFDTNLYAIASNNGSITWSTDLADPCTGWFDSSYSDRFGYADGWSEPALGPDGTIYVSFDDPYLRAVDPNGSIKWVTRLGMMGGFTLTIGSDGLIYAASDDAYLCVIDPNGKEIARFKGDDWLSFPVITADNTMIVSDANNTVWAIGGGGCEGQAAVLHRPQDLSTDWGVNFKDYALIAADWLECTDTEINPPDWISPCDYEGDEIYLKGDIDRNLYVDFSDLSELANRWLSEE